MTAFPNITNITANIYQFAQLFGISQRVNPTRRVVLRGFIAGVYPFERKLSVVLTVITKLNLASNPFRNRALPWTVTAIITLFSVVALVFIAKWTFETNAKAQTATRDVAALRQQTDAINQRAEAIKTVLTPEQKSSLKSTHTLVSRKQFSWSRLFSDLENALPSSVRVTRIAVKEARVQDGRTVATLELIVASKNPATVTQMIEDMERQGIFHAELVSQNLQRGKEDGGAEYEMNVVYTPPAGASINVSDKNNRPVDTASEGVKPR